VRELVIQAPVRNGSYPLVFTPAIFLFNVINAYWRRCDPYTSGGGVERMIV